VFVALGSHHFPVESPEGTAKLLTGGLPIAPAKS
jgi:hypothetical protein